MNINLITVCTDNYPMEYAERLIKRMTDVSYHNITPYCITDRPCNFAGTIHPMLPGGMGWWNKIQVFEQISEPGWNLYMDIDIVINHNFDHVIDYIVDQDDRRAITCVEDAIGWMDNRFSSSWMMFYSGAGDTIVRSFMRYWRDITLQHAKGGDQVWIGKHIKPKVHYINKVYPNLKKNLKFDLGNKMFGQWQFPMVIDENICLIDCGGRPKPHQLENLPYIKRNWHDVRI